MTPAARDMPVTTATWDAIRKAWLVALPGNLTLPARDEEEVRQLCARHVPGDSIRFVNPNASRGTGSA